MNMPLLLLLLLLLLLCCLCITELILIKLIICLINTNQHALPELLLNLTVPIFFEHRVIYE